MSDPSPLQSVEDRLRSRGRERLWLLASGLLVPFLALRPGSEAATRDPAAAQERTTSPHYGGEVVHGRPMKGHGWQPMTNAQLVRMMAEHVEKKRPER